LRSLVGWLVDRSFDWKTWGMVPRGEPQTLCSLCGSKTDESKTSRDARGSLDDTCSALLAHTMPSADTEARVHACVASMDRFVHEHFPLEKWIVAPFGGCANGFGSEQSDVDIVIHGVEPVDSDRSLGEGNSEVETLLKMRRHFETSSIFEVLGVIERARVPLLLLRYSDEVEVDLSINNTVALRETRLARAYATLHPRVVELGVLVKFWAKGHHLCGAKKGYISSWAFLLLTFYFLQVSSAKLPNFHADHDFLDSGSVDVAVRSVKGWTLDRPVATLVTEFFAFYAKDFKWGSEVVSVRHGRRDVSSSEVFQNLVGRDLCRLHIEDAFAQTSNLNIPLWRNHEHRLRAMIVATSAALEEGRCWDAFPALPVVHVCAPCTELQTASFGRSLSGMTALVMDAHDGSGFEVAVQMLCLGAFVVMTSRFPHATAEKMGRHANAYLDRLHVYGCDFRHLSPTKKFCDHLLLRYERFHVVVLRTDTKVCYNDYQLELSSVKPTEESTTSVVQHVGAPAEEKMSMTMLSRAGKHHFQATRGLQAEFRAKTLSRALMNVVEFGQAASRRAQGETPSRENLWLSALDAVTQLVTSGAEATEQSGQSLPVLELLEPLCVAVTPFMVASALRPKIASGACVVLEDSASKVTGGPSRQAALTKVTARALETLFAEDGVLVSTVYTGTSSSLSQASVHLPPADAARRLLQPVLAHVGATPGCDKTTAVE